MCLQLVTKDIWVLVFSQLVKWPLAKNVPPWCVQENASGHLGLICTYLWWDLFGSHIFGSRVRVRVKISENWSGSVTEVSMKNAFLEKMSLILVMVQSSWGGSGDSAIRMVQVFYNGRAAVGYVVLQWQLTVLNCTGSSALPALSQPTVALTLIKMATLPTSHIISITSWPSHWTVMSLDRVISAGNMLFRSEG